LDLVLTNAPIVLAVKRIMLKHSFDSRYTWFQGTPLFPSEFKGLSQDVSSIKTPWDVYKEGCITQKEIAKGSSALMYSVFRTKN
jgi:hypothetical protein